MTIIAFITDLGPIQHLLAQLGEPIQPSPLAPARGPPHWEKDFDQTPLHEPLQADPRPNYEFDQRVSG
jgi:hypothetical protein